MHKKKKRKKRKKKKFVLKDIIEQIQIQLQGQRFHDHTEILTNAGIDIYFFNRLCVTNCVQETEDRIKHLWL